MFVTQILTVPGKCHIRVVERQISTSIDQISAVQMFSSKFRMARGSNPHQSVRGSRCRTGGRRCLNTGSIHAQVGDTRDQVVSHRIEFDVTDFFLKTK